MRKWALLAAAILTEVTATLSLRAFQDNPVFLGIVIPGHVASFVFLALVLRIGMPVGVAYGIWTACGVALVALIARFLFDEPLTPVMMLGIALIVSGVFTIELAGVTH